MSWRPDPGTGAIDGCEPASQDVRPLRADGSRFRSYADALGTLSRPALFENRFCYRLLDTAATAAGVHLTFGPGQYFDIINLGESVAHEYAAATLAGQGLGGPPAMSDLPLRSFIGDPTSLVRRPVMTAVDALMLRLDPVTGDTRMFLHWRDPAKVATGGGLYQVAPVGMFQPSHDAVWNHANDFGLWRSLVRELSEELLGTSEDYGSGTAPIDYEHWPLYTELSAARQAGTLRAWWLALGMDPLTLVVDMLTVVVLDAPLFDQVFAGVAGSNDEGHILGHNGQDGYSAGIAFTADSVGHFTSGMAMQSAGAALLRLAWQHRTTLLARP